MTDVIPVRPTFRTKRETGIIHCFISGTTGLRKPHQITSTVFYGRFSTS